MRKSFIVILCGYEWSEYFLQRESWKILYRVPASDNWEILRYVSLSKLFLHPESTIIADVSSTDVRNASHGKNVIASIVYERVANASRIWVMEFLFKLSV